MDSAYIRSSTEGALPPHAEMNRYETFTYKLKCYGRDFDKNMPYALKDRMQKEEFVALVEKVNDMMERRPAELEGYALECARQKRKWLTAAIASDLALAAFFVGFVISFAAFWVFLGLAVDDVFDWWWPIVIAGAVWIVACFMMVVLATLSIVCHQKHKKWSKITKDEENLQKYHGVVRFLRRENERNFAHKGISWELSIMQPEQHSHGWTDYHHPTLDIMLYQLPQSQHSQLRQVSVGRDMSSEGSQQARYVERRVMHAAPKPEEPVSAGTSSNQRSRAVVQPVIHEEIEVRHNERY